MKKGVDLSTFQKNVDYQGLKDSGVDFAIIRVGYGKDAGQKDAMFETHYRGCKDAGIKVGVYHYSYCTNVSNAEKEAQNCLNYLDGKELDLPVFYDLEDKTILNNNVDATEISLIFCNIIKENGYKAGVYANLNWFRNYIDPYAILNEDNKIWLAQWDVEEPTAEFPWQYWQFTNHVEVGNTSCDGDFAIDSEIDSSDEPEPEPPDIEIDIYKSLAVDVIYGKYGNGQERKDALGVYYEDVQNIVNDMYRIIKGE